MNGDWVAVATRARGIARRRLGAGTAQELAAGDLPEALGVIAAATGEGSDRGAAFTDRGDAEHAMRGALLWRTRVLAGWAPRPGAALFRVLAAPYERDNAVALARSFDDGTEAPTSWELGSLATAWPRLRLARDFPALREELGRSPWGRVGATGPAELRDELTAAWLRRVAVAAPFTRPWAVAGAALLAARVAVVQGAPPTTRCLESLRPFLGETWATARTLDAFAASLPYGAAEPFRDLDGPEALWLAEARLVARIETDSLRLLRRNADGPAVVVAVVAMLAVDVWRARAAVAVAGRHTGGIPAVPGDTGETAEQAGKAVLDVVA
ncbi:hypothetical protein ABCS02_20945 [Microbacterium sp. X-17]|uniref:hypothetical protein n=1 Tax=Microbacterium sp. X-17 TaxID=3144404 RepID=UPI0031F59093